MKATWFYFLTLCLEIPADLRGEPTSGVARSDAEVIQILLDQDLGNRRFPFPSVIKAATGKKALPLQPSSASHVRIQAAIQTAIAASVKRMNQPDSPVRGLRRINEASRFFEDDLMERLAKIDGVGCEIPINAQGRHQRVGYPDLKITDRPTGEVFYLDPKLVEKGAIESTLRTFYFEPRKRSGKILDDAVHLLIGIEHDGNEGAWQFIGWRLVDLSTVSLRLKAEFQTSNSEIYRKSSLSIPAAGTQSHD